MRPLLLALLLPTIAGAQTICLDPGHPSEVGPGTRGKRITELRACWLVAQALKTRLERDGYRVVMTKRSEGELVRNRRRAEIANAARADLLLRLHCDAAAGRGFATFYPDRAATVRGVRGPSSGVLELSAQAARRFHPAVIRALGGKLPNAGLKTDRATAIGAKQGALTGSVFSRVPVLLVEMVVLTNPKDEAFLTAPGGIGRMADALRQGVRAAVPLRPRSGTVQRRSAPPSRPLPSR